MGTLMSHHSLYKISVPESASRCSILKQTKIYAASLPSQKSMLSGSLFLGLPNAHCECDVRCVRNELSTR